MAQVKEEIKNFTVPTLPQKSLIAARGVSDENGLEQYINMISKIPILTASQEYDLAKKWQTQNDKIAAEKIVASHLRMVVSVAYDFKNYGIGIGDLIASGNLGLMQAIGKFDPDRGFRFSTYAMFWIKAEMYEMILSNWSLVKIGTSANHKKVFFNLGRAKQALGIMDNKLSDVQVAQIAKYLDVGDRDVLRMMTRMGARDLSLNAPSYDDSNRDMLSNLESGEKGIEDTLEDAEFRRRGHKLLTDALNEMKERDREILIARRLSDPVQTLETLSQKYGISRERVRQIEERSYEKLKEMVLQNA